MAEFLRLAGDAVKKRETAILEADDNYSRSLEADDNYFLFNGAQCRRLWKHLSAVSCAFAPSLSYYLPVQQMCLPLHKEFYNIVLRADEIFEKCSYEPSWLKEAIFLGGSGQVFQELSADLQSCMRNFHYLTESLFRDSLIRAPSSVVDVAIPEAKLDEDLHKDVTSLIRRLQEREVDLVDQEKQLASYIVERGIIHRVPEPGPDNLEPTKPKKVPFYEVYREDPVLVKNIAQGASGVVSEVKWLGLTCAMKAFLNVESTVDFVKEVSALAALSHSRTVKLLCSNGQVPNPYFIMEFMPMTLEKFCKRENAADSMRFEILPSINMMLQISSGMEYLHDHEVVHRDLKAANILVRESHDRELCSEGYVDVKLTDFGIAKMKVSEWSTVATCRRGTTQWSAPEVLGIPGSPLRKINWMKADTYSFAVVCSEILSGRRPYIGESLGKPLNDRVISGGLRPKLPKDCPPYLREFLSRCWDHKPTDRPMFKEITQTLNGFKNWLLVGTVPELTPKVWCPDPEEKDRFEAALDHIYGRMEMMEALCSEMQEHLRRAKICHVQCGHLVKSYLEGFPKVRAVLKLVSPMDFWNLYTSEKLKKFSESMDGLICSTMAVADVVRACGGSEWMLTALTIFNAALPEARGYCSIFGLHLWNLYWNLFVIDHAMQIVIARQPSASLQLLGTSSKLRVQWCKERCKLVLQKVTGSGHEDGDGEFLQADADRLAKDRSNLIKSLENSIVDVDIKTSRISSSRLDVIGVSRKIFVKETLSHLRNRLRRTSDPLVLDSCRIDNLEQEAGRLDIGYEPAVFLRDRLKTNIVPQDFNSFKIDDEELAIRGKMAFVKRLEVRWTIDPLLYDENMKAFMTKVSMLAKLQHPNIVQFIGWKKEYFDGYIVTELMEQDLDRLIWRNLRLCSGSPFSLLVAIDILLQIVEAMIHIHKCGVTYRDLRPSNILVSPKYTAKSNAQDLEVYYTVKLTDFRTAKMGNSSSTNHTVDCAPEAFEMPLTSECVFITERKGTTAYMAPEVMDRDSDVGYTYSVDAYSFGMTAYVVTTGLRPFESWPRGRTFVSRVIDGERPRFPDDYASDLKELIEKCWSGDSEKRPSFEQIRKDLWTSKYRESIAQ